MGVLNAKALMARMKTNKAHQKQPLFAHSRSIREDWRIVILLCLGLLISACQPGITASPIPTPQVIEVQLTAALLPLQPALKQCVEAQQNSALILQQHPAQALDPGEKGIGLRWGLDAPPEGSAAVIGAEELVVIIHSSNLLDQISLANLQAMYNGARKVWPKTGPTEPVQPWVYPAGEDIQSIFISTLLKGILPTRGVTFLAPDPQAMLEAVAASPGAIGFVPRRWLSDQVKELEISGIERASLKQPILALSKAEPAGLQKQWLLCVKEAADHTIR
jgi:hypothetical protein